MAQETWLVAHDFSPPAEAAADLALTEALRMTTPVRLVITHVFCVTVPVTPEVLPGTTMIGADAAARNELAPLLDNVAARLHARLDKEQLSDHRVEIELLAVANAPAQGIVEQAKRLGATRIIMGTHGRRGFGRMLLGSVAERVVRLSPVPVLVTPERKSEEAAKLSAETDSRSFQPAG